MQRHHSTLLLRLISKLFAPCDGWLEWIGIDIVSIFCFIINCDILSHGLACMRWYRHTNTLSLNNSVTLVTFFGFIVNLFHECHCLRLLRSFILLTFLLLSIFFFNILLYLLILLIFLNYCFIVLLCLILSGIDVISDISSISWIFFILQVLASLLHNVSNIKLRGFFLSLFFGFLYLFMDCFALRIFLFSSRCYLYFGKLGWGRADLNLWLLRILLHLDLILNSFTAFILSLIDHTIVDLLIFLLVHIVDSCNSRGFKMGCLDWGRLLIVALCHLLWLLSRYWLTGFTL